MRVSVLGLGYVGCVSAACLADLGHEVVGLDVNPQKVAPIQEGRSPIVEPRLDELIEGASRDGRLTATVDYEKAVMGSDVSLVCVGTPSTSSGKPNLDFARRVCDQIGEVIGHKNGYHSVVFRSTVLPGTVENVFVPILERRSGKEEGQGFGVCFNPEFLREASAVHDFYHPPKIVVGERRPESRAGDAVVELNKGVEGPIARTDLSVAEMVKYADNCFHGVKVCFANEIGILCKELGVSDSHEVMSIFCLDTKLNLSPYYLKPGFAFGGSCLPKDLRAIVSRGRELGLSSPLLESVMPSNQLQIERAVTMIRQTGKKKVGVLGMSFKAGTDDLRESPIVQVVSTLIGKGYELRIYDRNISWDALLGDNLGFLEHELPYALSLKADSVDEVVEFAEVLVVANSAEEFRDVPSKMREDQIFVDLVRIVDDPSRVNGRYVGISW